MALIIPTGPRGSGKTTIARQLQRIFSYDGFEISESNKVEYVLSIRWNIVRAAQELIETMRMRNISFETELPEGTAETITGASPEMVEEITPELKTMIKALWQDTGVKPSLKELEASLK